MTHGWDYDEIAAERQRDANLLPKVAPVRPAAEPLPSLVEAVAPADVPVDATTVATDTFPGHLAARGI